MVGHLNNDVMKLRSERDANEHVLERSLYNLRLEAN